MPLQVFNTMTGTKEPGAPLVPGKVGRADQGFPSKKHVGEGVMPPRGAVLLPWVVMLLAPAVAWADAGELAIGPLICATLPLEGRAGLAARVGVGDWLAIDTRLAAGLSEGQATGVADVGLIAAWDVLSWVPEARLAGGGRWFGDRLSPLVSADLGVRHYVTMSTSMALAGGAQWNGEDDIRAVVSLTVWVAID